MSASLSYEKPYRVLDEAVRHNNDGKIYSNVIGCETTANYIYLYYTEKEKIYAFYKEFLNENDFNRENLGAFIAEDVSRLWDDGKGGLFDNDPFKTSRKYEEIVRSVRTTVENRQRDYLSGDIQGAKRD